MKEFPPRILDLLKDLGMGDEPIKPDADAAIAWIESAQDDRQFSDADQRDLNIGRAIQRAAMELPENIFIVIDIECGSGKVTWFSRDALLFDIKSDEPFSSQIHAAIDAAIASVSHK